MSEYECKMLHLLGTENVTQELLLENMQVLADLAEMVRSESDVSEEEMQDLERMVFGTLYIFIHLPRLQVLDRLSHHAQGLLSGFLMAFKLGVRSARLQMLLGEDTNESAASGD